VAASPSVSSLKVSLYAPPYDGVDRFGCRALLFHHVLQLGEHLNNFGLYSAPEEQVECLSGRFWHMS
jgi:hypothetical protein